MLGSGAIVPADVSVPVQGATAYPVSAASARVRVADFAPFLEPEGVSLRHISTLTEADYAHPHFKPKSGDQGVGAVTKRSTGGGVGLAAMSCCWCIGSCC